MNAARTARFAIAILLSTWHASPAVAAEAEAEAPFDLGAELKPVVPAGFDPTARGLSPQPLVSDSLGLAMYPPAGSGVEIDRSSGQTALSIFDPSPSPAWSMTVQHLVATAGADGPATPAAQIGDHLTKLTEAGRPFRVIVNEPREAGSLTGHLCYLQQTTPNGEPYISGYFILPAGPGVFTVFSILASVDDFPRVRPVLDASLATVNLRSTAELSLIRGARLQTGRSFLASITPEQLRELDGLQLMSRIYRPPGAVGESEVEIGYSLLEVSIGKRGAVNENRAAENYSAREHAEGLLVRIQGRIIGDASRGIFYDSIATFWMAWDQSEEDWSFRGTQRQGAAERSEAETAFRNAPTPGNPRPILTVIRSHQEGYQREPFEWEVPDTYLSQALSPLLGRLLPKHLIEPREFSYYFYNYDAARGMPQLTQRIDRWAPAEDGSGNWVLTTRMSADASPIITTYSRSGELVHSRRADGVTTEPTTVDALRRLWERKGLPVGETRPQRPSRRPR